MTLPRPLITGSLLIASSLLLIVVTGWEYNSWLEGGEVGAAPISSWLIWVGGALGFVGFLVVLYGVSERIIVRDRRIEGLGSSFRARH